MLLLNDKSEWKRTIGRLKSSIPLLTLFVRQKKKNLSVFLKATRAQDAIVSTVHRWASASQKYVNLTNIDQWKQYNFRKREIPTLNMSSPINAVIHTYI